MIRESSGEGPDLGMLTGLAFAGFDEADVLARLRALCFSFLDEAAEKEGKPLWLKNRPSISLIWMGSRHCCLVTVVSFALSEIRWT